MTTTTSRIPEKTIALVLARANGMCESCGRRYTGWVPFSISHRRGKKWNRPADLEYLCGTGGLGQVNYCHDYYESSRTAGYHTGHLVKRNSTTDCTTVPVLRRGTWGLYDNLGNFTERKN